MWPFKSTDEKLNEAYKWANTLYEENNMLKSKIKGYQDSLKARNHYYGDEFEKDARIKELETKNEELSKELNFWLCETHGTRLPPEGSTESWYDLKVQVRDKDKEIETLKKILEFSEEDKQEWKNHKEIFNYMVKKGDLLKERIKELEGE